jgi:HK97 family phage major capsid protein
MPDTAPQQGTKSTGQILTALGEKQAEIQSILGDVRNDNKSNKEATEANALKLEKAEKAFDQLLADYKGLRTDFMANMTGLESRVDEMELRSQRPGMMPGMSSSKSLGEQFTGSDTYKSLMESSGGPRLESGQFKVKGLFTSDWRDGKKNTLSIGGSGSVGQWVLPTMWGEIITPNQMPLVIRDLLTVEKTSDIAIEYVVETGFTDEATSTQLNGAAAPVSEGADKPEAKITFTTKTASARTIAHWIPITRQALASISQVRAYIDNRLLYGLKYAEQRQLLYGNGTDPNILGILSTSGIQTYRWQDGPVATDTMIDAIRRAITKAMLAQYEVSGIVMHPTDWETVQLQKGTTNHYIWVSVTDGGVNRLWQVPVVVTPAINQGTALVGAFRNAFLWDTEEANIRISESHANFFTQNKVAILCEERAMLTLFRPESMVKVTLDHAPVIP